MVMIYIIHYIYNIPSFPYLSRAVAPTSPPDSPQRSGGPPPDHISSPAPARGPSASILATAQCGYARSAHACPGADPTVQVQVRDHRDVQTGGGALVGAPLPGNGVQATGKWRGDPERGRIGNGRGLDEEGACTWGGPDGQMGRGGIERTNERTDLASTLLFMISFL